MKKILIAAAALVLAGATSVFAGGVSEASVQPVDCARDANNDCIVAVVGPASSAGLLLGGLGAPAVIAGVAALVLFAAAAGNKSTPDTQ